ncbi:MAG: hypothetical protein JW841_18410 [Deltaproteobacteria bacterium]|nr:hypothetical protein [Deltaproteobacteria bacterium]
MKKLSLAGMLVLALLMVNCGDDKKDDTDNNNNNNNNNISTCFEGTPSTNLELITACTATSVIAIDYNPTVKHKNADGTLPTPPDSLP